MARKKGQVWIETVIYTMIAFVLIATVLAFVRPKIEEMQDETTITRSLVIMKDIDSTISNVLNGGQGNRRLIEIEIKKGTINIQGIEDKISFEILSKAKYSEPGMDVFDGNIKINTIEKTRENLITLERAYNSSKYNITYNKMDINKQLTPGNLAYKVFISNRGTENNKTIIDLEVQWEAKI